MLLGLIRRFGNRCYNTYLFKKFGIHCGTNLKVKGRLYISGGGILIGSNVRINSGKEFKSSLGNSIETRRERDGFQK